MNDRTLNNVVNIDAEQALLGAILVNNEAYHRVAAFMKPDHFFEPIHRKVFDVIGEFIRLNKRANPVTLKNFLPADERIGEMTVSQYLARLAAEAFTVINAEDYGVVVTNLWQRRRMITIGEDMVNKAFDAPISVDAVEIAAQMSAEVAEMITSSNVSDGDYSAAAVADSLMSENPEMGRPVSWPLNEIREVMQDDARSGKYYGILSSSGEGKTSLVLQCANHFVANGSPCLLLSYDQSGADCAIQMATQHLGIEGSRIRANNLTESERERYFQFLFHFKKQPIEVHQLHRHGMENIRVRVTKFIKKYGRRYENPPVVIVDHMKKIPLDREGRDPGTEASIKNGFMKALGVEFDAVMIGLMQRNSEGKKRSNPRPIESDLYGGEAAREDFDSIIYLYRPDKYKEMQLRVSSSDKETDEINKRFYGWEGQAELGAIKVRFGNPNHRNRVNFNAPFTRYESLVIPELIEDPMRPAGRLF